jgi:hypothetical protein
MEVKVQDEVRKIAECPLEAQRLLGIQKEATSGSGRRGAMTTTTVGGDLGIYIFPLQRTL